MLMGISEHAVLGKHRAKEEGRRLFNRSSNPALTSTDLKPNPPALHRIGVEVFDTRAGVEVRMSGIVSELRMLLGRAC